MDNQNPNGINQNSEQTVNSSLNLQSNPTTMNNAQINPPLPNSTEMVKPTLDSILNGEVNSTLNAQNNMVTDNIKEETMAAQSLNSAPVIDSTLNENANVVENNNENLTSTAIETLTDVAPVQTITNETIEENTSINQESMEVNPQMQEQPTPQDDFNAVPVPPIFNEEEKEKKKKDSKRTLIIILIFILVIAIGFGVYYFLTTIKNNAAKISVVTKEVKLELGDALPQEIENYATISGYNKQNCTLDISKINIEKVSTYKFYVTCGTLQKEGIAIVDDTTAPKVITNDVIILPNATLKEDDFIENCIDASACTYEFASDVKDLTSTIGEYEVPILVTDNFNNETTVIAKLTVSTDAPVKYITCISKEQDIDSIYATLVDSYKIGVDATDNFYNAIRTSKFNFVDSTDYNNAVNSYNQASGINNIIGTETFDAGNQSITIKSSKTFAEMSQDLNGNLPTNINILKAYMSGLGYTCN